LEKREKNIIDKTQPESGLLERGMKEVLFSESLKDLGHIFT
jgi:hypothetical protein